MQERRGGFRSAEKLSGELREVFAAFAPEGGIGEKRFDCSHDLSKLPGGTSRHPAGDVTIAVSKGNDEYSKRNFRVTMTWQCWEHRNNSTSLHTQLEKSYWIFLGVLRESKLTDSKFKTLGGGDLEVVEIYPFHLEKGDKFPPDVVQELVEIGRLLAAELKMDIKIPDALMSVKGCREH